MLVKCIDSSDTIPHLSDGFIYEVKEHPSANDHYHVKIDGLWTAYLRNRFEEITVYKVRAKENASSLIKGKVYEVVEYPADTSCYLVPPYRPSDGYYKSRFDLVDDRLPSGSRPLVVVDAVEERYRKILTTRDMPGECPCGTNIEVCRFHKKNP